MVLLNILSVVVGLFSFTCRGGEETSPAVSEALQIIQDASGDEAVLMDNLVKNHPEIAMELVSEKKQRGAWRVLHYAIAQGLTEVVKILIEKGKGVDLRVKTAAGLEPLHVAIAYANHQAGAKSDNMHLDIVRYLLTKDISLLKETVPDALTHKPLDILLFCVSSTEGTLYPDNRLDLIIWLLDFYTDAVRDYCFVCIDDTSSFLGSLLASTSSPRVLDVLDKIEERVGIPPHSALTCKISDDGKLIPLIDYATDHADDAVVKKLEGWIKEDVEREKKILESFAQALKTLSNTLKK